MDVSSGGVRGRDGFGARFWGPNGSDRRHSSQALPTDQVALHRAPVDHWPLTVPQLALTQSLWVSVCVWGCARGRTHYFLAHTNTHLSGFPSARRPQGGRQITMTDTHMNEKQRTQLHTRARDKHDGLIQRAILSLFTHTFHRHASSPFRLRPTPGPTLWRSPAGCVAVVHKPVPSN